MMIKMLGMPTTVDVGKVRFEKFDNNLDFMIDSSGLYIKTVEVYIWPVRPVKTTTSTDRWFDVGDIRNKLLTLQNRTVYTISIYGKFRADGGRINVHQTLNLLRDGDTIYRMCGFMWNFETNRVSILSDLILDERLPLETIEAILEM